LYDIVESKKTFEQAGTDLEAAVVEYGFGVLHIHNLGQTLRKKGIKFAEDCKVFEVCQPEKAAEVLSVDMRLNMALPCRISVYTEKGTTKIGVISPAKMLSSLSEDESLRGVAQEVDDKIRAMMEAAK